MFLTFIFKVKHLEFHYFAVTPKRLDLETYILEYICTLTKEANFKSDHQCYLPSFLRSKFSIWCLRFWALEQCDANYIGILVKDL